MKQAVVYGIFVLFGLVAMGGVGITTFLLGEHLSHQTVEPTGILELEPVKAEFKAFQLVAQETELNFECPPGLISEYVQVPPDFEVVLVSEPPDPGAPNLVSFSGCPLTDRCAKGAAETY